MRRILIVLVFLVASAPAWFSVSVIDAGLFLPWYRSFNFLRFAWGFEPPIGLGIGTTLTESYGKSLGRPWSDAPPGIGLWKYLGLLFPEDNDALGFLPINFYYVPYMKRDAGGRDGLTEIVYGAASIGWLAERSPYLRGSVGVGLGWANIEAGFIGPLGFAAAHTRSSRGFIGLRLGMIW